MKTKTLVLTFSYNQIMKEWVEGKDYRLPTLEEAKLMDYEHKEIWIDSENISDDHYAFLYNREDDRVYHASRNFCFNAVLIKDVDVVVEWGVSSKTYNTIFKFDDRKDEALEYIDENKDSDALRLVKITKEYYR